MPRARVKASANSSAAASVGTAAADTFITTIGALYADLEIHRHRIVEIETLIAGLEAYGVAGENLNRGKRRAGRPPANAGDELRQRKAKNMRAWRARQVQTPRRKRRRQAEPKPEEPTAAATPQNDVAVAVAAAAAVAPLPAVVSKPCKHKRRVPQRLPGWTPDGNAWRQPAVTTTETTDAAGIVTRIHVTEGERPPLQGERPQL